MPRPRPRVLALGAATLLALATALVLEALTPAPNAQPSHGTEGAFATGMFYREIVPGRGPQRWTGERGVFRFERLPQGPASLEVRVRGQRTPLRILVNGALVGEIPEGRFVGRYALPAGPDRGVVTVEIVTAGFPGDDGERRGALIDRVRVVGSPGARPAAGTLLLFLLPALALAVAGLWAGLSPAAATLVAMGLSIVQGLALWTDGQVYSPYASTLAIELAVAAVAAAGLARAFERRREGAGAGAFVALLLALSVQGIAATSPVMVSSDVVFHANQLRHAADGALFPTSVTQHQTPFQIPYGVSFYALLAPFVWLGLDRMLLVTAGAGLSGVIASAALFDRLCRHDVRLATASVVALQCLPGTFGIHSYGNLSNAFGQAVTVLFFCWWSGPLTGGLALGTLLFAVAGISHLSSLIVLVAVSVGLAWARWPALRADHVRLQALALGATLTAAYYSRFASLVVAQLPRLLEGGGQGHGVSRDAWGSLVVQLQRVPGEFGWPVLLLAVVGVVALRRAGVFRDPGVLRDLGAYAVATLLLALPAIVSPLEVRYLYALGLPVAVAAGRGFLALQGGGGALRAAAWGLAAFQGALAALGIAEAVLHHYRP
jgi:hypothetical protein